MDDKTLKVELDYPVPFFDQLVAFPPFYPIREDFYNKYKETICTYSRSYSVPNRTI